MPRTVHLDGVYLAWCEAKQMDPDETATASAYEDHWLDTHGVPDHVCPSEPDGYCDVCRA